MNECASKTIPWFPDLDKRDLKLLFEKEKFLEINKKCLPEIRQAKKFLVLFHKFVDGLTQIVDGILISGGDSIHHAVTHVIL